MKAGSIKDSKSNTYCSFRSCSLTKNCNLVNSEYCKDQDQRSKSISAHMKVPEQKLTWCKSRSLNTQPFSLNTHLKEKQDSLSNYKRIPLLYPWPFLSVIIKGVGPSTTLAWPGWRQPDISVKVDTAQLGRDRFKKYCVKCVFLYYSSNEFESTFNVYWHRERTAGLSCTELSFWEFPFLKGAGRRGRIVYDIVNGMPQKETLDSAAFTCMLRILSTSLTWVLIFSVWCYSSVSISVVIIYTVNPHKNGPLRALM